MLRSVLNRSRNIGAVSSISSVAPKSTHTFGYSPLLSQTLNFPVANTQFSIQSSHLNRLKLNYTENRSFSSSSAAEESAESKQKWLKRLLYFGIFNVFAQIAYGSTYKNGPPAFSHSWLVYDKDPYAIQDFYSGEDLLQVLGIHPFITHLMLGQVVWWDPADITDETSLLGKGVQEEGHVSVKGLGAEISFNFLEEEGENDEGEVQPKRFEKLERFIQFIPGLVEFGIKKRVMDYTIIFGFRNKFDGTCEVYHKCIEFRGPWLARIVLYLQYTYVAWATEAYMNGINFGDEDRADEAHEELAFLIPHIYGNLIDKLLDRKIEVVRKLKLKPKAERTEDEEEEIRQGEMEIVRMKTMKVNLSQKKGSLFGEDGAANLARSVSIRKADLEPVGVAPLMKQKSVRLSGKSGSTTVRSVEEMDEVSQTSVKFVAGPDADCDAALILQTALKDAKHDAVVHQALQEVVEHPDLKWTGGIAKQKSVKVVKREKTE